MGGANGVYARERWGVGERGNSKDWAHVGGVALIRKNEDAYRMWYHDLVYDFAGLSQHRQK
jgi:hypothetical protein